MDAIASEGGGPLVKWDFVGLLNLLCPGALRYFHVDRVGPLLHHDAAIVAYEIRFASFYCQAKMAVMAVNRDMKVRDAGVQISYSTDPCESGE